jgi:hypothetical protein
MFDVSVWSLLHTHPGDSIQLEFSSEVTPGTWEDLEIVWLLSFKVQLIALENGVDAILEELDCIAKYEWRDWEVSIDSIERTFVKIPEPNLPDDINPIDMKHATIPLGKVLREEILMQIL